MDVMCMKSVTGFFEVHLFFLFLKNSYIFQRFICGWCGLAAGLVQHLLKAKTNKIYQNVSCQRIVV